MITEMLYPAKLLRAAVALMALASWHKAEAITPAVEMVEIKPEYPKPMYVGPPITPPPIANFEDPAITFDAPRTFKAPKGTTNVALHKNVTSSDNQVKLPTPDALKLITDGDADASDDGIVELAPGPQWVQIDLEMHFNIHKILVWHFHRQASVVKSVIVQISDDPKFETGVTTVYNADIDNTCNQGKGSDKVWVQTSHGRLIDGKATNGRYVRLWSNGSTMDELNRYIEVSVYGTEAK